MKDNDLFPGTVSGSGKRVELNGRFYRMRRGKMVRIPDEWVGETVHDQTRPSASARPSPVLPSVSHATC